MRSLSIIQGKNIWTLFSDHLSWYCWTNSQLISRKSMDISNTAISLGSFSDDIFWSIGSQYKNTTTARATMITMIRRLLKKEMRHPKKSNTTARATQGHLVIVLCFSLSLMTSFSPSYCAAIYEHHHFNNEQH